MEYDSYQYIVPIPYGSTLKQNKIQLTLPSHLIIQTAQKLYTKGKKILLCGEESFEKKVFDTPVTTHLMQEYLLTHLVNKADIISVGKENKNTVQQIHALATYQKKHTLSSTPFLLLCLPYHKKRLTIHAKAYGLTADIVPINTIFPTLVTKDTKPLFAETFEPTEKLSRILSSIDTKGYYSNLFTSLQGPRVVDIVNGKAKII